MISLVAAVALLCIIDLLLTLGVVKRLRELGERQPTPADNWTPVRGLVPGSTPAGFTAVTTEGVPVSLDSLMDGALVVFLSPHCKPCVAKVPEFIELAAALPDGKQRVLTVLTGEEPELSTLAARLEPVAHVVTEPFDGPLTKAFGVQSLPVVYVLDGHQHVAASSPDITEFLGSLAKAGR